MISPALAVCSALLQEPAAEPGRPYGGVTEIEAPPVASTSEIEELRAEVAALRERLEHVEAEHDTPAPAPTPAPPTGPRLRLDPDPRTVEVGFGRFVAPADYGLRISGYLQTQYFYSQLSENQYQQGGVPLNRDGFAVRRGRLRVSGDWKFVAFAFEVDGSTTRGPFIGVRQAHVSALWRNPDAKKPPYIMATAGLTEVPFGYELRLPQRDLYFMERSLGGLALFPGPVDIGLRLRGGVGPFRYDLGVMNGSPLPDVAGIKQGFDPTKKPDVMGRLGFDVRPKHVAISGGASFLSGTGLHQGQDATKNHLEWQDLNENGTIDTGETFSVPGTAALPSVKFSRWAVNADLELAITSKIGLSQIFGEVTIAQNLDRGLFVADPFATGSSLRHLQAYAAYLQDITKWAVAGLRYDFYDYDSDLLTEQRGRSVPADARIHTFSPLVGAVLPGGIVPGIRARLLLQYDVVLDALGRDRRGVPANLKNDQLTVRVHLEF